MRTPGKVNADTEGVIFVQEDGINICSMYPFNRAANAQFLIKAWNCHDELVAALKIGLFALKARRLLHAQQSTDRQIEVMETALALAAAKDDKPCGPTSD